MGLINGLSRNAYLYVHILGGGILAKVFLKIGLTEQLAVLLVIAIAIAWEVLESFGDVEKVYGSKKRFRLDALQDIIGAVLMAVVVVI